MKYLITLSFLLLTSCAMFQDKPPVDKVVYIIAPLSLPDKPTLPTWSSADMKCLSVEMKQKILSRDQLRKQYADELEAIIRSTHKK